MLYRYLYLTMLVSAAGACGTSLTPSHAPPGQMVPVGEHRMHIRCVGEGSPTILLDAGAGGWSIHWGAIQPALAARTRPCAFDRSGLRGSEAGTRRYSGRMLSRELHDLVRAAGITTPFIYVGHSMGGNLAQIYYGAYPEEIAGIVVVDPGRPADMLEDYNGTEAKARERRKCGFSCGAGAAAANLGVVRLAARKAGSRHMSEEENRLYRIGAAQARSTRTLMGYLAFFPTMAYETMDITSFGDIPFSTILSGATRTPE